MYGWASGQRAVNSSKVYARVVCVYDTCVCKRGGVCEMCDVCVHVCDVCVCDRSVCLCGGAIAFIRGHLEPSRVLPVPTGSTSGQGTRSHMPQRRVHMPQVKILPASTKIEDLVQPNKYIYIYIYIF